MIKAKQKTIRIFDISIDQEDEFFSYLNKNLILLKEFLLVLSGDVTKKTTKYLSENNICYVLAKDCHIKLSSKSNTEKIPKTQKPNGTKKTQNITVVQENKVIKTLLLEKPVRSGEEIVYDGDITIFGRVNSASKVIAEGNVEIYGTIDGVVQCDGDYMIVKEIGKGYIIFNGDILDRDRFDGKLKRITSSLSGVIIKDVF